MRIVHISGQVAVNEQGQLVGGADLQLQSEQVFRNIQTQLERAGGSMKDLIRIDCYFKDLTQIAQFRTARNKFIDLNNPPTSTAVQVSGFVGPDFLIEINAVAAISRGSSN